MGEWKKENMKKEEKVMLKKLMENGKSMVNEDYIVYVMSSS